MEISDRAWGWGLLAAMGAACVAAAAGRNELAVQTMSSAALLTLGRVGAWWVFEYNRLNHPWPRTQTNPVPNTQTRPLVLFDLNGVLMHREFLDQAQVWEDQFVDPDRKDDKRAYWMRFSEREWLDMFRDFNVGVYTSMNRANTKYVVQLVFGEAFKDQLRVVLSQEDGVMEERPLLNNKRQKPRFEKPVPLELLETYPRVILVDNDREKVCIPHNEGVANIHVLVTKTWLPRLWFGDRDAGPTVFDEVREFEKSAEEPQLISVTRW